MTQEPTDPHHRHRGMRIRSAFHHIESFLDQFWLSKWRSALQREARRQEDVLMALLFLEGVGIENPAGYQTLDMVPELIESFHRWHREQGIDRFPDVGVCC